VTGNCEPLDQWIWTLVTNDGGPSKGFQPVTGDGEPSGGVSFVTKDGRPLGGLRSVEGSTDADVVEEVAARM